MPKMRKWREKSNVLMSYFKKFGIWIKMKKKPQTNLCISAQRKIKLMFIFWGHTMPIYYVRILCTYALVYSRPQRFCMDLNF